METEGERAWLIKTRCPFYLTNKEQGMKDFITWSLKELVQREAVEKVGAGKYERIGFAEPIEIEPDPALEITI